jgi:hypothetical protein
VNRIPVLKHDLVDGKPQYILVADMCSINKRLLGSAWPTDDMQAGIHRLANAKYFVKLEIIQAYWTIPLDEYTSQVFSIGTGSGVTLGKSCHSGPKMQQQPLRM